jgi:hypothetical protein
MPGYGVKEAKNPTLQFGVWMIWGFLFPTVFKIAGSAVSQKNR